MGEKTSRRYKYVGSKWKYKVYKGRHLMLQGQKNKGNISYLDDQALNGNRESKVKKKVKFPNVVEVLRDTSVGGGVCSLSN